MIWTPAATAELLRLYAITPELSFAEIATGLHEAGHVFGRNAVIGKAHRMCLPPRVAVVVLRAKVKRQRNRYRKKQRRAPMPIVIQKETPPLAPRNPERSGLLIDLDHDQCRWPVQEISRAVYLYCTADKHEFGSYCVKHHALAHVPVRMRA